MSRVITCQNTHGSKLEFSENSFLPFMLASVKGIYDTENDVVMPENTMSSGGTYQGSRSRIRYITLTIIHNPQIKYAMAQRDVLRELFLKDDYGTLTYTEDGESRKINYYVEYIRRVENKPIYMISLKCDDPYFYAENDNTIELATWVSAFTFPHDFLEEGEEFGYRSSERIAEVINDNASDNIGLTIKVYTNGTVVNPQITRVESDESVIVGTTRKPFTMTAGDVLTITTGENDKHVYLTHNQVTTEVNEYLAEESEFIQLMRGENHFGYSASSGESNMVVTISYRLKYEGC